MVATVTTLGSNSGLASTSLAITVGSGVPAGSSIVVWLACTSLTTALTGVTDSQGNTYTKGTVVSTTGGEMCPFYCLNTTHALTGGTDTITGAFGPPAAGTTLISAAFVNQPTALDVQGVGATGASTSPTAPATGTLVSASEVVFGFAMILPPAGATYIEASGFTTGSAVGTLAVLHPAWEIVSSNASVTYQAALSASRTWIANALTLNLAPPTQAVGASAGSASVTGRGNAIKPAAATASGSASPSGVGASTTRGAASASGGATASGRGDSTTRSTGAASGSGSVSARGNALKPAVGSSHGAQATSGIGRSTAVAKGAASGAGVANGQGRGIKPAASASAGSAAVVGHGASTAQAQTSVSGAASAQGSGASLVQAVGSATGSSSTSAHGAATGRGTGLTTGNSFVDAVGFALIKDEGTGNAAGQGVAAATGASTATSTGLAQGAGVAQAQASSTARGVANASGSGQVGAAGSSLTDSAAAASGASAVVGNGASIAAAVGGASGSANVTAAGTGINIAFGHAAGHATPLAIGTGITAAVGSSSGHAAVSGLGTSTARSVGSATGAGSVSGAGARTLANQGVGRAVGQAQVAAPGTAIAAAVGSSTGQAASAGAGHAIFNAAGQAAGASVTAAAGLSTFAGAGAAFGMADVEAQSFEFVIKFAQGTALGQSDVEGGGGSFNTSYGTAAGVAEISAAGAYAPYPSGKSVQESVRSASPMAAVLATGLNVLDRDQVVCFTKYVRVVLPIDGYVFWVRASLLNQGFLQNVATMNEKLYGQRPELLAPAPELCVQGSLHVTTQNQQDADESFSVNTVIFTALSRVNDLNEIAPSVMYIAHVGDFRFAFSERTKFYEQAGLYHYTGHGVYPVMEQMFVDDPTLLDANNVVVSNSLPWWLTLDRFAPVFPSFAVPDNIRPPYVAVHIPPDRTRALQNFPTVTERGSHWQLTADTVRVTLYGMRNHQAVDWLDYMLDTSLTYDVVGMMSNPSVRDDKRTQTETSTLAIKKVIEVDVSYYQARVRDQARQLIKQALVTFLDGD